MILIKEGKKILGKPTCKQKKKGGKGRRRGRISSNLTKLHS